MSNYLDDIALEIRSEVPAGDLPDETTIDLFRSYAVLLLAKCDQVSPEDVHNAWVAWMLTQDPNHESLIPFEDLDEDTAASDEPFVTAIRLVSRRRSRTN